MVGRPGCTSQAGSVPAQSGSQRPGPAGADCSCTSGRNHIKSSTGALSSFLTLHFHVSSYSCCHRNINKYSDVYNCEQNGLGKKKENGLRYHQSSVCVHCAACLSSMAKAAPAPTARGPGHVPRPSTASTIANSAGPDPLRPHRAACPAVAQPPRLPVGCSANTLGRGRVGIPVAQAAFPLFPLLYKNRRNTCSH